MPKAIKSRAQRIADAERELRDTLARVGYKGKKISRGKLDLSNTTSKRLTSDKIPGNGAKKESPKYTGNEIAGIVVTHKSNLMPVRKDNKQAAIDAANMRR